MIESSISFDKSWISFANVTFSEAIVAEIGTITANDNTTKMRSILESLGVQTIQTDSTTNRYSNIIEF